MIVGAAVVVNVDSGGGVRSFVRSFVYSFVCLFL